MNTIDFARDKNDRPVADQIHVYGSGRKPYVYIHTQDLEGKTPAQAVVTTDGNLRFANIEWRTKLPEDMPATWYLEIMSPGSQRYSEYRIASRTRRYQPHKLSCDQYQHLKDFLVMHAIQMGGRVTDEASGVQLHNPVFTYDESIGFKSGGKPIIDPDMNWDGTVNYLQGLGFQEATRF